MYDKFQIWICSLVHLLLFSFPLFLPIHFQVTCVLYSVSEKGWVCDREHYTCAISLKFNLCFSISSTGLLVHLLLYGQSKAIQTQRSSSIWKCEVAVTSSSGLDFLFTLSFCPHSWLSAHGIPLALLTRWLLLSWMAKWQTKETIRLNSRQVKKVVRRARLLCHRATRLQTGWAICVD